MKLRTKLLVGYAGFVLALGVLGAWSARTLSEMSKVSGRIIAENYDSVVAAQDMKESLERQDSAALFDLLGQRIRARLQVAEHRARFDAALDKAAGNITEIGEPEAIDAIRKGRDEYYRRFDAFLNTSGVRTPLYFQSLEPQFNTVWAQRPPDPGTPASHEHQFRVKHFPDGAESTVTVAVDPEAVERVARLTHRRLEPKSSFWRLQANGSCRRICGAKGRARPTAV
jgi:hypothetical protein